MAATVRTCRGGHARSGRGCTASGRAGALYSVRRRGAVCVVELRTASLANEPCDVVQQLHPADDDPVGLFHARRTHHPDVLRGDDFDRRGRGHRADGLGENFPDAGKLLNFMDII